MKLLLSTTSMSHEISKKENFELFLANQLIFSLYLRAQTTTSLVRLMLQRRSSRLKSRILVQFQHRNCAVRFVNIPQNRQIGLGRQQKNIPRVKSFYCGTWK